MKADPTQSQSQTPVVRSGRAVLREAAPGWSRFCGWCARTTPVGTDGRNLLCTHCGY